MKYATQNVALVAAGLASTVSGLLSMQVRYTDNMIDVGNLDAFSATWETIYAASGNLQGVVLDNTYQTDQQTCQTDDKDDLTVRVTLDGAWGAEGDATSTDVRNAIVSTLWSSIEGLWNESQYTVYEGCYGTVWMESPAYTADAACGPESAVSCEAACADENTPALTQCQTATSASKLPSKMKVTVYDDEKLLADELTVTFAATANDISDGGCGMVGVVAQKLAGFIPGVGSLFAEGIAFECSRE